MTWRFSLIGQVYFRAIIRRSPAEREGLTHRMPRPDAPSTVGRTASVGSVNPRRQDAVPAVAGFGRRHAGIVKVLLLAESFLPHMNGVTHSLLQVLRHLDRRGHDSLVVAPRSGPIDHTLYG